MEQYLPFVSIQVQHTYYTTPINSHISLSPTSDAEKLMRRRGILFMENEEGWAWLVRKDCAGFEANDVLELSMQLSDTKFLRVTRLNDYYPPNFYQLRLENKKVIDAASSLTITEEKKWKSELCRIRLSPTAALLKKAQKETPMIYTIQFRPLAYQWEYFFVIRDDHTEDIRNLLLEETKNRIIFDKAERLKNSSFGAHVWRIVSTSPVSVLECPDYSLLLSTVLQEYPLKKRTVSKFIDYPQPGKYISDDPNMLRKVCYI